MAEIIYLPTPKDYDPWEELERAERRVEDLKRELGLLAIERGLEG